MYDRAPERMDKKGKIAKHMQFKYSRNSLAA